MTGLLRLFVTGIVLARTDLLSSAQNVPPKPSPPSGNIPADSDLYAVEGKLVYVRGYETKSIDGVKNKIALDGGDYFGFLR